MAECIRIALLSIEMQHSPLNQIKLGTVFVVHAIVKSNQNHLNDDERRGERERENEKQESSESLA